MRYKTGDTCPRCGGPIYNCGCREVCEKPGCMYSRTAVSR